MEELIARLRAVSETGCDPDLPHEAADAIVALARRAESAEKERDAIKRELQETRGMGECMLMLRQDMIDAGVLDAIVPPMMMSEAIIPKLKERDALAVRNNEHEIFRHQHRDCDAMGVELQNLRRERDALAAKLKEQDARIDDLLAICHRLALELECLLLDTKDLAPVSRWWDSATAALDGWHKAKDAASVRPVPAERPTPATRPGWRDINDIIADREKDPSKAAALERAREWLLAAQPIIPVEPVNARLLDIATGKLSHLYAGLCPDSSSGTLSRDPECPACRAISAAESQQAEPVRLTDDSRRLDWIEQKARESRTGVSFDFVRYSEEGRVIENGYRVMWRNHLGERFRTLREVMDDAMNQEGAAVLRANGFKVEG